MSSPEVSRNNEFRRKNQRKGLIRIITSRMKDKEEKDHVSDTSSDSVRSRTKKSPLNPGNDQQRPRNPFNKYTLTSLKKKTSSDLESPYSSSPLSTFRKGRERSTMIRNIQHLIK